MLKARVRQWVLIVFAVGVVGAGAGVGAIEWRIREAVRTCSRAAQQAHPHPGDDVAALLAYVESPAHSLADRNRAVWALGRLRDPRALAVLGPACHGGPCDHPRELCQRELGKAIGRCGGTPGSRAAPGR